MTKEFWDNKLISYSNEEWANKPSIFAAEAIKFFPKTGKVLELGAGIGQDSIYFASNGFQVTATDFSTSGLDILRTNIPEDLKADIGIQTLDLSHPFSLPSNEYAAVYAHLSLHYFDNATTVQIFDEIFRIIKPGGILAILLNSTTDPEYGIGELLEADYYEIEGIKKRFFSPNSLERFVAKFEVMILDSSGQTYKDNQKGVKNLVRFIGQKPKL